MSTFLVQDLGGRHLVMKAAQGTLVTDLIEKLSEMSGVPRDAFYLTEQDKPLNAGDFLWLERDERVVMRGRLREGMGGASHCQNCGRQGCFVTNLKCCRCGKSKSDKSAAS